MGDRRALQLYSGIQLYGGTEVCSVLADGTRGDWCDVCEDRDAVFLVCACGVTSINIALYKVQL